MFTDAHPDGAYSWLRLALTLAIACVGTVGIWAIVVILPALQAEFQVDRAGASLPYTMTMVGFGAGSLFIGRAVDRWGVTAALIGASVVMSLGFGLSAASMSLWLVSLLHLLIGFGTAAGFAPLIADISHWFVRRRGIAVAVAACGNYLSGAIWPVVLAGVQRDHGWRGVYVTLAVVTLAVVVPLSLLLRRRLPEAQSEKVIAAPRGPRGELPFSPLALQLLLGLAGIGCCVAMAMPQVHIVALCADIGLGPAAGAEMLSVMLLGGVVSRLASGLVADRIGGLRTILIGSVGQCIALFLYLPFDGPVSLYLVSLVFGLSQGGIVPSYALIVREYMPAREAGARVGFVIMMTIAGMALGGWMSGWIYDQTGSYHWAFINGIGWNFLNIGILAMLLMRSRPRQPVLA